MNTSPPLTPNNAIKDIFSRIGNLTRLLHNSITSLAFIEAAEAIPDTRKRLNYVVDKTTQAAEKALSSVEVARPLQSELCDRSTALAARWNSLPARLWPDPTLQELMQETQHFLNTVPDFTHRTDQQLIEIMMAQDFQDLTGQVIKKLMGLIENIEQELVSVLLENMPEDAAMQRLSADSLKNGPQVDTSKAGVVATQVQVDDLLDSLGF